MRFSRWRSSANTPLSLTLPEDSVPSIEADPDRVKQLLAILLNNAFDHTPAAPPWNCA